MRKETKYKGYSCDALGNVYNRHGKKLRVGKNNQIPISINGNKRRVYVSRVIWEAFNGEIPKDMCVMRKHDKSFSLHNLYLETQKGRAKKTSHLSRSKEVVLLDENGEFIRKWKSARKCALDMFCSHQTVANVCNGKIKKPSMNLKWYR